MSDIAHGRRRGWKPRAGRAGRHSQSPVARLLLAALLHQTASHMSLFDALTTGGGDGPVVLGHRIVLAPLTRNRATEPDLCPHGDHVEYYTQRASEGGLLITEATCISPEAVGYTSVPGIWTEQQTEAWASVADGVHAKGGKVFMQLWCVLLPGCLD